MRYPTQLRVLACLPLLASALLTVPGPANAEELQTYQLDLKDHQFSPPHLVVPAQTRFLIQLTNQDDTNAEFESFDMKFEKIVVGGGHVIAHAGPLPPGTYTFFDDYHPETKGTLTATDGAAPAATSTSDKD